MKILLTNDDSHNSCLLPFALQYFRNISDLEVIVPLHEQSWRGKAMSRFGHRSCENREMCEIKCHVMDGTPADCANAGIYHLFKDKPDLVVSGINVGLNAGIAFLLSSGTVGACLEANIAGLPGLALSQHIEPSLFPYYRREQTLPSDLLEHLREQTAVLLPRVFDYLLKAQGLLDEPLTWNVNLPIKASKDCKIKLCNLSQSLYGSYFARDAEGFTYGELPMRLDLDAGSDWQILENGDISVTPIDIRKIGRIT